MAHFLDFHGFTRFECRAEEDSIIKVEQTIRSG
jgi:hypothetical protein